MLPGVRLVRAGGSALGSALAVVAVLLLRGLLQVAAGTLSVPAVVSTTTILLGDRGIGQRVLLRTGSAPVAEQQKLSYHMKQKYQLEAVALRNLSCFCASIVSVYGWRELLSVVFFEPLCDP